MPLRLLSTRGWLAFLLLGVAVASPAAESGDSVARNANAPYEIQADNAVFDQQKGEGIYTGQVQMDKGDQHIRADRVRLTLDKNNKIRHIWADGKPVSFTDGEDISGHAKRMEYDLAGQVITLYDDAEVSQGERVVTGSTIIYHTQNQRIEAKGKQGERVKLVLPPDDTDEASSSGSANKASSSAAQPATKPASETKPAPAKPASEAAAESRQETQDAPTTSAQPAAATDKPAKKTWNNRDDAEFFEDAEFIEEDK